jgi:uncharacterized protein YdcH (DUF465 family)
MEGVGYVEAFFQKLIDELDELDDELVSRAFFWA